MPGDLVQRPGTQVRGLGHPQIPAIGVGDQQVQSVLGEVGVKGGDQGCGLIRAGREGGSGEEQQAVPVRAQVDGVGVEPAAFARQIRGLGE